ncbi:MAG: histidine phosphatase family protein [Rhodospirillaceae bacterium]
MTLTRLAPVSFYFLRHGETDWNRRRVMQGHTDIPLNACGIAQAEEVAPAVAQLPIVTICCSTLGRARRTAELVNIKNLPIIVIDDLKECGFGIYEGQDSDGAWREDWRAGGLIPGGESLDVYVSRLARGLNAALANPAPILIVGHGGSVWPLERLAEIPPGLRIPNCALFRFDPPSSGSGPWSCAALAEPASPSVAIGEARPSASA